MSAHHDLVIVGSGSGNSILGPEWDGRSVGIVEGGTFGGTCLNVGCIPTKMFVYPAGLAAVPAEAARLGVDLTRDAVHWQAIRDRIFGRIDAISADGRAYRDVTQENVTLYAEHARLTGPRALVTDSGRAITTDQLVIAAGSRPRELPVPGAGLPQVHTSDTIMRIPEAPRRLVIVGGGYVAAEFAAIFGQIGVEVTQVVRGTALLTHLDATVAERFTAAARGQWDVRLSTEITGIAPADEDRPGTGPVRVGLMDTDGNDAGPVEADLVLIAAGRIPNTDRLDAAAAGLDLHPDGRLAVDAYQRVLAGGRPVPGVWALGDVSSEHQLKHVANHEARVVAHNLTATGPLLASDHRFVPSAVFTHPQLAQVGMTEAQAREHCAAVGEELAVVVQDYGSTAYGWAMEDTTGIVKLIAERGTGRLLGAHLMGHEASMLIQPLIQAMHTDLPAHRMARGQYWIHPALTEVVENALLGLGTGG
ncbi:mycothione reductase [Tersicoccus solisilvae]|uniref:Mycothione reductase n=1 Tax=Tersicoccus solisilvae TaxID=1882339 RepID=A0ABQ1PCS6_9MICC|nr:mycothione reductase [Tersicoccus solisilvae]GGC94703.1 mycothione reductase [Tersicoccus solisilvae]